MNIVNQDGIESSQMPQDSQDLSANIEQSSNHDTIGYMHNFCCFNINVILNYTSHGLFMSKTNIYSFDIGTSQRKGRGMTTGASVEKKRRRVKKLDIVIHSLRRRIVGDNAKDFKTEAGVNIKQHVPLQYPVWKDVPVDIKRKVWLGMKVWSFRKQNYNLCSSYVQLIVCAEIYLFELIMQQKFNLKDDFQVKKIVYQQLNRQYRSYRSKLHEHFLKYKDDEVIKRPGGVSREGWELLINYFESDDFKV